MVGYNGAIGGLAERKHGITLIRVERMDFLTRHIVLVGQDWGPLEICGHTFSQKTRRRLCVVFLWSPPE